MSNLPYNAVMVDLETMSTESNAAIISIGAVKFCLNVKQETFSNDQFFHYAVDLKSSQDAGLHIDANTVKWWLQQSKEAQDSLLNGLELKRALHAFSTQFCPKNAFIFGNGASFDNVILRSAYKAVNLEFPSSYKYDVCYRTLCKLSDVKPAPFEGTKHNALDDAIAQTLHLMQILDRIPWVTH